MIILLQDGYAVVASDGPGEYPVILESRAGSDATSLKVTPGTVAYVTTGGGIPFILCVTPKW
jgi:gephyrin